MVRAAHPPCEFRLGMVLTVMAGVIAALPVAARAQADPAVVEKITALNKKALDAYSNLEFEDARRTLKQALELCSNAGLDRHPIKARTHIHMGVVLVSTKQEELGIKQFRKALDIQSDIQVTRSLANPEILQAFEEATALPAGSSLAAEDSGRGDAAREPGRASGPRSPADSATDGAASAESGIRHFPVARSKKQAPISIVASVGPGLTGFTKLVLGYRAEGTNDFVGQDMKLSGSRYVGEIPAEATRGGGVAYFIQAEADDETPVASAGSEERPFQVTLVTGRLAAAGSASESGDGESSDNANSFGGKLFVGVLGGWGTGYITGNGEVNKSNKVKAGLAPSSVAHVIGEVGYFLGPDWRLSLQVRYQIVSGPTPLYLQKLTPPQMGCGSDNICTPTNYALAVLARSSWFFGSDRLRPYFSLAAGGGQIRHIVEFDKMASGGCGPNGDKRCVDTVLAGPVLAGAGGGMFYKLTSAFGLVAEINTLVGFPNFTAHVDLNAGVAAQF